MSETLKEKTARGLFWGALNNGTMQFIGLVFGIVLGRLLNPDDYGMISVITIFTITATALQDSGFGTAIVNLDKPRDEDYNSVFWFNILTGLLCYVILFFSAPLIAHYYHQPKLVWLSRYVFLSIIFSSLGVAQSAYLQKHLMVKQRAKANVAAVLLSSSVGVVMAWKGFAYWSLATQSNVYVLANMLFYWHYSRWRPTLHIDFGPVRRMFRFSCKILATTLVQQVNNNILNILLGHYYSAREAGYYNQAYQWNSKVAYLMQGMVGAVSQPVLVDLRSNSGRELAALRKLTRFTAFLSFPLLLGFGLVAKEFIVLAITAKWLPSAQLLQILCIGGAFMPLSALLSSFIISQGKSGTYLGGTVALCTVQIFSMLLAYHWGVTAMVIIITILNVVWAFVWFFLTRRLIAYSLWMFLCDIVPFALAATAVMAVTFYVTNGIATLWLLLVVRILLAAVLYFVVMKLARVKILDECIAFILHR
jgi:O-antigen/teichoic acid export membrane protein